MLFYVDACRHRDRFSLIEARSDQAATTDQAKDLTWKEGRFCEEIVERMFGGFDPQNDDPGRQHTPADPFVIPGPYRADLRSQFPVFAGPLAIRWDHTGAAYECDQDLFHQFRFELTEFSSRN